MWMYIWNNVLLLYLKTSDGFLASFAALVQVVTCSCRPGWGPADLLFLDESFVTSLGPSCFCLIMQRWYKDVIFHVALLEMIQLFESEKIESSSSLHVAFGCYVCDVPRLCQGTASAMEAFLESRCDEENFNGTWCLVCIFWCILIFGVYRTCLYIP